MEVKVEPAVLQWNRERMGVTPELLAAKLEKELKGITPELIRKWEDGTAKISWSQLKHVSKICKRPLAVFFLASPPSEKANPPDRRTFGSKHQKDLSPEINLVIRRARRVQALAAELREDLQLPNRFIYDKYLTSDDPVTLASRVRAELGLSVEDQRKAAKPADLFNILRAKVESTGVITIKTTRHNRFPLSDARAFSFVDTEPFVVVVNGSDADVAQNFSLMHEFAHLLVRQAGICNNFRQLSMSEDDVRRLEAFCNRFAAAFLIPKGELLSHRLLRGRASIASDELDAIVDAIVREFKVSRPVVLGRLLFLELVSQTAYKEKIQEWEKIKPKAKKGGGKTDPSRTAITGNGPAFSSLVVKAYREKRISYSGIVEYLGIRAKYIPRMESLLSGRNA